MILVRRISALALVVAALAVYFLLAPKKVQVPSVSGHTSQLSTIGSEYDTNNTSAQYIYGQIYAAGVATKDTLALMVQQADEVATNQALVEHRLANLGPDKRIPAEIALAVIGLAVFLVTAPAPRSVADPGPTPEL